MPSACECHMPSMPRRSGGPSGSAAARAVEAMNSRRLIMPRIVVESRAMFTGIVEKRGKVLKAGRRMSVDTGWPDLVLGESISVSGVCLTVARIDGPRAGFDLVAETLRKTTMAKP